MKSEVNRRDVEWWLYRSGKKSISDDLKMIVEMMKNNFLVVGPFGSYFVKENRSNFKPFFYEIPLQYSFVDDHKNDFEGLAYVAPCGDSSILLRTIFDFLRSEANMEAFTDLKLTAICVQHAENQQGQRTVVAVDCIEDLNPLGFYEHPSNGRLLQAFENMDPPEQTAFTLYGKRRNSNASQAETLRNVTNFYNEFEFGDIEKEDLAARLFSYFEK
jgi:hypothetical protein